MKSLTITSQQLKFVGGIFLACLIIFGIWWFVFHNEYEKISVSSAKKLVTAINQVCNDGVEEYVDVYFPQQAGFKGWLYQHTGIAGGNVGTDPYFYIYYEKFPPESEFLPEGVPVIAPWSEDLPWSSNLMGTAAMDMAFFGLNMGFGKMGKASEWIKGKITAKSLESKTLQNLIKAGKIIVDGKDIIIKEAKYLAAGTAAGTVACLALTDKNLGECVYLSAVGYSALRVSYKAVKYMYSRHTEKMLELGIKTKVDTLMRVGEESADEGFQSVADDLIAQGKIEVKNSKYIVKDKEWKEAIEMYTKEIGTKEKLGAFEFVGDDIYVDQKSWKDTFLSPFKKAWDKIESSLGEAFHQEVIAPSGTHIIVNQLDVVDEDVAWNVVKKMEAQGYGTGAKNKEEAVKFLRGLADKLRKEADEGAVLLLPKDSKLAGIIQRGADPETLSKSLIGYLENVDENEAKYLYSIYKGTKFRIGEKIGQYTGGTLGYTLLRIQDMYTPLGATWLDKQISYYAGADVCGENEICLRSGYRVIHFPSEEYLDKCVSNGIENIKLKRDGLVAPNPDFYLVSPCFANIKIWKEGDTVYLEPKLCQNRPDEFKDLPNYCYATSGIVNYYVGTETLSFFADCIGNAICCIGNFWNACEGGLGIVNLIKSCTGLGIKVPSLCGALGQALRLTLDVSREGVVTYPYVPELIQDMTWDGTC